MCPFRSAVVQDRFSAGGVTNLCFSYFEGFNEGVIGREAEMRGSLVECGERQLEGGQLERVLWNFSEAPHEQWYHGSCGIHVPRSVVHAKLHYWIMSQDCRNTFLMRHCCGWPRWSVLKFKLISRLRVRRPNLMK